MRILTLGRWADGYLDYHRLPPEYRVKVSAIQNLEPLPTLNFIRPHSGVMLWNYLWSVGLRGVVRRVRSRLAERGRNEKLVSCGIGEVVDAPGGADLPIGEQVVFVAPAHPACAERICLPRELIMPLPQGMTAPRRDGSIMQLPCPGREGPSWWSAVRGWSPYSERPLDARETGPILVQAALELDKADWSLAEALALDKAEGEAEEEAPREGAVNGAVLFGYGNYAKVAILPNVTGDVRIARVHEVDPTQIGPAPNAPWRWSTSPGMLDDERPSAVFIAGFHHTHAPLAVEALRRGAYAVVEKPVVTTRAQLEALSEAMRGSPRLFGCFHKRYSAHSQWARKDLGIAPGDAVNYHCIVYEVPLPDLHWYHWPSSRGRLVSNGCHWIDHFLFLNDYCQPLRSDIFAGRDGALNVSVELENGGLFSMALTDRGSSRIGVRDRVELRAGGRTVIMEDASRYRAEDGSRIFRRARVAKTDCYRDMYRTIARKIARSEAGDPASWLVTTSTLILDLEEAFEHATGKRDPASA